MRYFHDSIDTATEAFTGDPTNYLVGNALEVVRVPVLADTLSTGGRAVEVLATALLVETSCANTAVTRLGRRSGLRSRSLSGSRAGGGANGGRDGRLSRGSGGNDSGNDGRSGRRSRSRGWSVVTAGRWGPDLGAGDGVARILLANLESCQSRNVWTDYLRRGTTEEVEENAGVSGCVTSVEVEVLVGDSGAGAGDVELDAAGVELGTTSVGRGRGVGLVVGNDLLADHVLACGEGRRELEVVLALVLDQGVDGPGDAVGGETRLVELGPDGPAAVASGELCNVGDDRSLVGGINNVVAAGVVEPLGGDGVTSSSADELRGDLCAVDVAVEGGSVEGLDGAVVGRRADVDVLAVALVDAVDEDAADLGVGGDGADEAGRGGDDRGTNKHVCGDRVWVYGKAG